MRKMKKMHAMVVPTFVNTAVALVSLIAIPCAGLTFDYLTKMTGLSYLMFFMVATLTIGE